jgi:serine/threonine protein kinase
MKQCERCGALYQGKLGRCPLDGGGLREAADPRPGSLLAGRYRLGGLLGESALAQVYEAEDERGSGERVAVKILRAGASRSPKLRERFERESSLGGLVHPGIVRLLDQGQGEAGELFLVMERLTGEPLSARLARGPLGEAQARSLGVSIAGALEHAHAAGVVHRDLKPANIFLHREGDRESVKLLDFGLARVHSAVGLTATGELCGTPLYMAPEQIESSKEATAAADLYALGCVLYEALVGHPPFRGTVSAVLEAHLTQAAPRPSALTAVDPALDALVLALLDKDPAGRPDARRVIQTLG